MGDIAMPGAAFNAHKVSVRGRDLTYFEAGSGPVILFVHGSTGPEPSLGKDLLTAEFRVIEIEQPGFGNAPDDDITTSYGDLAEQLAEAMAALGVDHYHVVGASMGGITALHLTAAHPERVLSLTLESSMAFLGNAFARPTDDIWGFLQMFVDDPNAPAPPFPPSPRKPWEDDPNYVRDQFRRRLRVVLQDRYYVKDYDDELARALEGLEVPVQVLYGDADIFLVPGTFDVLENNYRRAIPHATFQVVAGAGHDIQGETPEVFVGHVTALAAAK